MEKANTYCIKNTFTSWVTGFLKHLKLAYDPQQTTEFAYLNLSTIQYLAQHAPRSKVSN